MRAAVSTVLRTAFTPARWPAMRGRCRRRAQRPLPSMMMAMCLGRLEASSLAKTSASLRSKPSGMWVLTAMISGGNDLVSIPTCPVRRVTSAGSCSKGKGPLLRAAPGSISPSSTEIGLELVALRDNVLVAPDKRRVEEAAEVPGDALHVVGVSPHSMEPIIGASGNVGVVADEASAEAVPSVDGLGSLHFG